MRAMLCEAWNVLVNIWDWIKEYWAGLFITLFVVVILAVFVSWINTENDSINKCHAASGHYIEIRTNWFNSTTACVDNEWRVIDLNAR
jgi:predicted negative regulator of RcsB-dependent stress response